jgi:hypothetical protein
MGDEMSVVMIVIIIFAIWMVLSLRHKGKKILDQHDANIREHQAFRHDIDLGGENILRLESEVQLIKGGK